MAKEVREQLEVTEVEYLLDRFVEQRVPGPMLQKMQLDALRGLADEVVNLNGLLGVAARRQGDIVYFGIGEKMATIIVDTQSMRLIVRMSRQQNDYAEIKGIRFNTISRRWEGEQLDSFYEPTPGVRRRQRDALAVVVEAVLQVLR